MLFTCCYFSSLAQNTRIGFTGGASFANYHSKVDGDTDDGNSLTGFTAGLVIDCPISEHFSFQSGLNFVQKGTKDEQTFGSITEKVTLRTNHLEVPMNFLYNVNSNGGNFFIGAGPFIAFAVSGKWKYEDNDNSLTEDVNFGNTEDDDMKSLDFGANFCTGFCFPNGLFIAANYNMGMSNLAPQGPFDGTLKSHYFGVRLGYLLKGKNKGKK